jgi:EAL domain-containing protein (putative c-di-GMP-specific phosphodiesterase class I)
MLMGSPRAVHLAPASLTDGPFVAQLREALARAQRAAGGMWLEVPEDGVRDQHELLRAFAAMVRAIGVRFGLEHAGQAMHRAPRLYEAGLDYVKLDSALLRGVALDEALRIPSSAAARRSGHRSSEVDFGLNAAGPQ